MTDTEIPRDEHFTAGLMSDDEIREFQRLVHETTGTWLDENMAAQRASQLLYLTLALANQPAQLGGSNVVHP